MGIMDRYQDYNEKDEDGEITETEKEIEKEIDEKKENE